jgi:hypothetical protein
MRPVKILTIFGLLLMVAACTEYCMICALNPFYTEKYVTLVPEIEGKWAVVPVNAPKDSTEKKDVWEVADTTSIWSIERYISRDTYKDKHGKDSMVVKPMNHYVLKLIPLLSDSTVYEFKMVLFRVDKTLYADFTPQGKTMMYRSRFLKESNFPVHTLARIRIEPDHFNISWLGAEYMKEMIEKKRVRVNYRWVKGTDRLLLTGTSEQLVDMIERYAGEPRFIDWENQQAMLKLNHQK